MASLCLPAAPSWAQSGTSSLQGTVADQQGAAIPGAVVVLIDPATGASRETVSGTTGNYRFVAVPPGTYRLRVELTGFRIALIDNVVLRVDSTTTQDIALQVGSLSETVEVAAEVPLINTTDASMGNVIGGQQIRELPLEGRNPVGLLSLQAGVTFVPQSDNDSIDPRYGSVSGARADQSNVTLDGIDVNDAQTQSAFTSALRVTLDSVGEFRVTTSNYGADQGRSSGAQVSLVTRSGTNRFHGAGYWVNRDTRFSANEYFLKLSQLSQGLESEPPLLDKNIFGGSLGGPIRKDRFFFFANVEMLDEQRETPVSRSVPSAAFRDGVLIYQCASGAACPGGTVQGFTGSHQVPAGFYGLTPDEIKRLDPLGLGPNQATLAYFRQFPLPNESGNYPGNIDRFRFAAPLENQFRTYISRLDYRLTGSQGLFARLNFQDDEIVSVPQFPDQPPNTTETVTNRGLALGHDWAIGSNKVNTFRYGYTLIDQDQIGLQTASAASFRFISDYDALTASNGREIGTHNIVNDFAWIAGDHTWKFGANLRWIRNDSYDNANSFNFYNSNPSWVSGVGRTYMPGGACPPPADCSGLPAVDPNSESLFTDPFIHMLGVLSANTALYNYRVDGSVLAEGAPIERLYAADEYEFYVQDSWRLRDNLTVTAGLRYSLFSPPYEANGEQVAPTQSLGAWFEERRRNMEAGIPSNASPLITFEPAGPKNDRRGYYDWDYNNFSPRVSAAWQIDEKTVLRGGYSLVYDRIGAGIATSFNAGGSFGLSTELSTPFGTVNEDDPTARFQGVNSLPPHLLAPAPAGGFPQTPPTQSGSITLSIDDTAKTPYSHVINAVFGRELGRGFAVEAAYVGRIGRNQLVRRDLAMPLNLRDPQSGTDYFTAARQAIDGAKNGVENMAPIPYWENLFPDAAGDGFTATQNIASLFNDVAPDFLTALWLMDQFCFPACSRFGPFSYFAEQYDSLAARSTIGRSEYHALQLSLRKRFTAGYQFDFNYTLARAKDHTSEVERGDSFGNFGAGGYSGFLVNTWEPDLNYSYSDYDVRHQINVNWLAELPFGRGKPFGRDAGGLVNALIGDWAIGGILRWTSGFPFNVINCRSCWSTNWNLQGNAELVEPGRLPETEQTKNAVGGSPSPFKDPQSAITYFRRVYPGETGIRNLLRGDGYFGIDLSVSKSFAMPFGHRLRFRWDIFNLTNAVRFDTGDLDVFPDRAASFGRYNSSLASCDGAASRCMQLNLRYEF
ncbi:MAG: TonB-dependent receptor [Vicinamibacteraceae bacterium]|nr:TonB-dependent receptor [Vicinamibacteraceae bacterium]